jgi:hypothetical protein
MNTDECLAATFKETQWIIGNGRALPKAGQKRFNLPLQLLDRPCATGGRISGRTG